jgi:hypothetical protein
MKQKPIEILCITIIIALNVFNPISCESNRNIQELNRYLPKADFLKPCSDTQAFLIRFLGQCYLNEGTFYKQLNEFVKKVIAMDGSLTLDEFLRDKIFTDFTKYFRETYTDNQNYIRKLDGIEIILNEFYDFIINSTTAILNNLRA